MAIRNGETDCRGIADAAFALLQTREHLGEDGCTRRLAAAQAPRRALLAAETVFMNFRGVGERCVGSGRRKIVRVCADSMKGWGNHHPSVLSAIDYWVGRACCAGGCKWH